VDRPLDYELMTAENGQQKVKESGQNQKEENV
jgi:hypothetical protein